MVQPTRQDDSMLARTTRCSALHVVARECVRPSKTYSGVGPDRSRRVSVGKRTLPDERAQLRFLLTSLEACNSGNALLLRSRSSRQTAKAMSSRCLDCSMPIEEELWWYDPSALARNDSPQVPRATGAGWDNPYPPTSVSGPFHKACLVQRMGRKLDSLSLA